MGIYIYIFSYRLPLTFIKHSCLHCKIPLDHKNVSQKPVCCIYNICNRSTKHRRIDGRTQVANIFRQMCYQFNVDILKLHVTFCNKFLCLSVRCSVKSDVAQLPNINLQARNFYDYSVHHCQYPSVA